MPRHIHACHKEEKLQTHEELHQLPRKSTQPRAEHDDISPTVENTTRTKILKERAFYSRTELTNGR
jgi:hypothetical protein